MAEFNTNKYISSNQINNFSFHLNDRLAQTPRRNPIRTVTLPAYNQKDLPSSGSTVRAERTVLPAEGRTSLLGSHSRVPAAGTLLCEPNRLVLLLL